MDDKPRHVVASTALYDGRRHLGEVVELGGRQFEAVTAIGVSLGLFDDRRAAEKAILTAAAASAKQ